MLSELEKSLLTLVDYETLEQPYYPSDSMYVEQLDDMCDLGILLKTELGYIVTMYGYTKLYEELKQHMEID